MNLKTLALTLIAAATLAAPATAAVIRSYDIAFTQFGLGDDAADWFGRTTVECDAAQPLCRGTVQSFSATIDGVTYDKLASIFPFPPSLYDDPLIYPFAFVDGFVFASPPVAGVMQTVIQMGIGSTAAGVFPGWAFSPCTPDVVCGGGRFAGSYALTLAPVPLPATLPLAALGVGALALLRRRRG